MAKRRKHRTHTQGGTASDAPGAAPGVPKSFVIKHGQVGSSLSQLVRDMRKVMEPNTASRLRERTRNKLKDFLTMAPALGVSHLLAFTLTPIAPSLRIVRLSNGPTLSFRIERYSLIKDMLNSSKHPRGMGMEYLSPPLLVLASFPAAGPGTPPHIPLLMKTFQSLFPPLAPQKISLSSARRVVLISYNAERGTIDFRHYIITVKPYGVSKRVRKVIEGAVPKKSTAASDASGPTASRSTGGILNLGNERDVADFVLRARGERGPGSDGYESAASDASSAAGDDPEASAINLADDYVGRNNRKGQRRAVRLDEIGPRMELRLVKIAEGIPGKEGQVIFHEFVKKTKKEAEALKAAHRAKEKLRKERKEEQERNIARKKGKKTGEDEDGEEDEDGQEDEDDIEDDEDEDVDVDDDGAWDEDEVISEGDEEDDAENSSESEPEAPPPKKVKFKGKR